MNVIARMRCHHIQDYQNSEGVYAKNVKLSPVYSSDETSPNYSFSKATPSGEISLYVTNPAAYGQFERNKVYDVTFSDAPAEAQS
jgi:hypothetical protein